MSTLKKLQTVLTEKNIHCAYIDNPEHIAYFTSYESDPHERILALIVFQEHAILFTPSLEAEDARKQTTFEVISYQDSQNPWKIIQEKVLISLGSKHKMGVEENSLTVERYKALCDISPTKQFVDISSYIENIKVIKTPEEIERMKEAGRLADYAVEIGISSLTEGITEQEVVAQIEFEMKKLGVNDMSFPTMVLFGDHAGSPHGTPGDRKLKKNELVLFDLGVKINGYTSDMTRTVSFGAVSQEIHSIYEIVLRAQRSAQKAVKPGVSAKELDEIARKIIEDSGCGSYFNHRLGHGLGKSVHEYPSITSENELILKEGMCFSIEPGIYIPGKIGVRIEDCVYVTKDGSKSFTSYPKAFQEVQPI